MNSFGALLKYTLIQGFGINKLRKRKRKANASAGAVFGLGIFLYLLIMVGITAYFYLFAFMFKEANQDPGLLYGTTIIIVSMFALISTIVKANGYLFRTKDYDMLMSLPISTKVIVATKLISLYLFALGISVSLFLATDIAYFIAIGGFHVGAFFFSFVLMILTPALPTVISSFIAFLFGFIPLPARAKSIISLLAYLVMIVLFAMLGMIGRGKPGQDPSADIIVAVSGHYFVSDWVVEGLFGNQPLGLLYFVLVNALPLAAFVWIVGHFFLTINSQTVGKHRRHKDELKKAKYHDSGATIAIFKKDFRQIIGQPALMANLVSGPIMSLVMPLITYFSMSSALPKILEATANLPHPLDGSAFAVIFAAFAASFCCMAPYTVGAISLEGKSFWVLKSSPVSAKSVFWGKILVNLTLCLIPSCFGVIISGLILHADGWVIAAAATIPPVFAFSISFFSLYINVVLPKFDHDVPVKAIKQSKAVFVEAMVSIFLMLVGTGGTVALVIFLEKLVAVAIMDGIGLVFFAVGFVLLFTDGVERYERLTQ